MNGNPLTGAFSPATRKALYTLHGLAVVVIGAVTAYCAASEVHQPHWLKGAAAALAFVGGALSLTAASNVPTPDTDEAGGDGGATLVEVCWVIAAASLAIIALVALGWLPR